MSSEKDKIKRRKKLKEDYILITKKDQDSLTEKQQKKYDEIRDRKNIAVFKKSKFKNRERALSGLQEFDSQSFKRIKAGPFKSKKKAIKKARDKDATLPKGYLTDIGKEGPVPRPFVGGVTPKKEKLFAGGYVNPVSFVDNLKKK